LAIFNVQVGDIPSGLLETSNDWFPTTLLNLTLSPNEYRRLVYQAEKSAQPPLSKTQTEKDQGLQLALSGSIWING